MVMIIEVNGPLVMVMIMVSRIQLPPCLQIRAGKAALARESRSAPFSGNRSRFKTLRLEVK